ncbi:galactose oxidase-like protein 4 [Elsinoe australis]|uniref:Galactose oxidase-like protein 4 n=1 Tax=Elsinoe australis TaxID=40998 RepID=A0A4U7AXM3_9PEZI|nr:galactose oxidase-like protein 4 [Elsinoe australis]
MSFFFKSSKKAATPSALPQATRNIKSSDGASAPTSSFSTLNADAPRSTFNVRPRSPTSSGGPVQQQQHNGSGSIAATMAEKPVLDRSTSRTTEDKTTNYDKASKTPSPENKQMRDRADSEPRATPPSRIAQPPPSRPAPDPSPYPWSQRQLTYGVPHAYPFPRYGPAINAVASRDGAIYIMGGLIEGATVKGDLWIIEAGQSSLSTYPVQTTSEGPGPRVGHASLLVGNAFIVFGGDTKTEESDLLDDTLYLLNTSTKQWSRAAPAGTRPPGRYGHTLNILGSKIYIFGGQVEGFFFNDLVAFDLNALQQATNRWEILVQNTIDGGPPHGQIPPARTNHSIITWNDRLYLFGGTDGVTWFNDVWSYDPRTNAWTQLDCIGYIPAAREGHAAALVGDVMYVFGGRTEEGNDLGDLAAFRISSRRWYTFQNMGPSPSPRSGHSMTTVGKTIVVLAGEPSSAPRDAGELSLAYFLDTTKIRYPADSSSSQGTSQQAALPAAPAERIPGHRRPSGEKSGIPQSRNITPKQLEQGPLQTPQRKDSDGRDNLRNGEAPGSGSRLPRIQSQQQTSRSMSPQPAPNGVLHRQQSSLEDRIQSSPNSGRPSVENNERTAAEPQSRGLQQPRTANDPATMKNRVTTVPFVEDQSYSNQTRTESPPVQKPLLPQHGQKSSTDSTEQPPPRTSSRQKRYQQPDRDQETPRPSLDRSTPNGRRAESRDGEEKRGLEQVDSGLGSSPSLGQNEGLLRKLEAEKSKNAWFMSELALARKAGYTPSSNATAMDESRSNSVGDEEKPLIEALLKMRQELVKMSSAMESKAQSTAERIAQVEKQRDMAVNEATFAKARLAAQGGNNSDGGYDNNGDHDRSGELNRRLATMIASQNELNKKIDSLNRERDAEKRARQIAEEGAETAQKRFGELETERQRTAGELESLRAELHEAQRVAREEAANASEASSAHKLLQVDKNEMSSRLETALSQAKHHTTMLASLQEAVNASSDKADHLERKLDQERGSRSQVESKLTQLKSQHEERTAELEQVSRQLRDAEELAEKHAHEAKTHRIAVMEGLSKVRASNEGDRGLNDERVSILQQQVDNANAMVRKNQAAADAASDKLRRAEERIAGLEAYQEQTSREGLSIRKQMQAAMKDVRALSEEKARLQQELQSQQLNANAIHVQHSALKDILSERGINPSELRKNRLVDSPSSLNRHGTPDASRLRDLEHQLEASHKAQDELRTRLDEMQERDEKTRGEYEEKLSALDNDHQAAAKYLRGTEKMLSKMKSELQRVKQQSAEYLEELETLRNKEKTRSESDSTPRANQAEWETERANLHKEIESTKSNLTSSLAPLEQKITALQKDLCARDADLTSLRESHTTSNANLDKLRSTHDASRSDIERLTKENKALEERARDAEAKVQMLLDQVESSVDNYRRQTADLTNGIHPASTSMGLGHQRGPSLASNASTAQYMPGPSSGHGHGHHRGESTGNDSVYSQSVAPSESSAGTSRDRSGSTATREGKESVTPRERNSLALNSLADELDGLRYRLSGKFDFEKTPTSGGGVGQGTGSTPASAGGLAEWRRGLERESTEVDFGNMGGYGRQHSGDGEGQGQGQMQSGNGNGNGNVNGHAGFGGLGKIEESVPRKAVGSGNNNASKQEGQQQQTQQQAQGSMEEQQGHAGQRKEVRV